MVWRRLPTFFPNISLKMLPLTAEQLEQVKTSGWLREVVFRTTPNVNKVEIRRFLEDVYNLRVERVSTINYMGKKRVQSTLDEQRRMERARKYGTLDDLRKEQYKRRQTNIVVRDPDWKKVYVILRPPVTAPGSGTEDTSSSLPLDAALSSLTMQGGL